MFNIPDISDSLVFKNGVWYSKKKSSVSYPDEGNDLCFLVEDNSFWFKHRNACIIDMIRNYPPGGEIFDIGGGNGFVAAGLEANGYKTILVEKGENGIKNAKTRNINNLVCSTFENAGFRKDSLPAAGLFDVLEHIKDDLYFLRTIKEALKIKGKLYLTVPALSSLWTPEDRISGHYRRYSKKAILDLLASAGFKTEYCTYFFFSLVIPVFILKVIPHKLGLLNEPRDLQNLAVQHKQSKKILKSLFGAFFALESGIIRSRRKIPFGSSLLISAVKK